MRGESPETPKAISYRASADDQTTVSVPFARLMFRIALLPSLVGMLIVAMFWLTDLSALVLFGVLWLCVGGCVVLSQAIWAVATWSSLKNRTGDVQSVAFYCGRILITTLVSLGVAVGCLAVGLFLAANRPFGYEITNASIKPVEVTLLLPDGPKKVGLIPPNTMIRTWKTRQEFTGPLDIVIDVDGRSTTSRQYDAFDSDDHLDGMLRIFVSEDDLTATPATGLP